MPPLEGSEFLRAWHARYPGRSGAAFGFGHILGEGRSSYALLVDDAAAARAGTIVDLACGDGYLLAMLARRYPDAQLIGVDMTPQELDAARERDLPSNVALTEGRVESLPFTDATIDAVVCHMALMLFDDAAAVIRELARVIRPGGLFAAVLGPGPGSSELLARFSTFLREAEAAENLGPLIVGDKATFTAETLSGLFDGDAWSDVRIDDIRLALDGSDEQVRASMLSMYNVARLSPDGRAQLERRLTEEMAASRQAGRPAQAILGLRHLLAQRAKSTSLSAPVTCAADGSRRVRTR